MINKITENYPEETFLRANCFDDAIIGVDEKSMKLIYSVKKCIEILKEHEMNTEEALEFFEFNVSGSYMGAKTPIWCYDIF